MANYLTTDTDLTAVANAIRTKGGTSASLAFPAEFVSAIGAISGGGGEMTLLASGNYVLSSDLGTKNMVIPVSVSGTPMMILVVKDTPRNAQQTFAWVRFLNNIPTEISTVFGATTEIMHTTGTNTYYSAKGNSNAVPLTVDSSTSPTKLTCVRFSNPYPIRADTYHWYIWGTPA